MIDSVDLGFEGLSIAPGTHMCALFRGSAERDQIMVPFLAEGLRAGHMCSCIVDDEPDAVRAALDAATGAPVGSDPRLAIRSPRETYLRSGQFSAEETLAFWEDWIVATLDGGYPLVRSAGETKWTSRDLPGLHDFMLFESELNRWLGRYPWVVICLYDLDRFSGEDMVDVMKTHPRVLMGGTIIENPHYLEPDEFLAQQE